MRLSRCACVVFLVFLSHAALATNCRFQDQRQQQQCIQQEQAQQQAILLQQQRQQQLLQQQALQRQQQEAQRQAQLWQQQETARKQQEAAKLQEAIRQQGQVEQQLQQKRAAEAQAASRVFQEQETARKQQEAAKLQEAIRQQAEAQRQQQLQQQALKRQQEQQRAMSAPTAAPQVAPQKLAPTATSPVSVGSISARAQSSNDGLSSSSQRPTVQSQTAKTVTGSSTLTLQAPSQALTVPAVATGAAIGSAASRAQTLTTNASTVTVGQQEQSRSQATAKPAATPALAASRIAGMTPVTLGNGQQVFVNAQGAFFDAKGNSISNQNVAAATKGAPAIIPVSASTIVPSKSPSAAIATPSVGSASTRTQSAAAPNQPVSGPAKTSPSPARPPSTQELDKYGVEQLAGMPKEQLVNLSPDKRRHLDLYLAAKTNELKYQAEANKPLSARVAEELPTQTVNVTTAAAVGVGNAVGTYARGVDAAAVSGVNQIKNAINAPKSNPLQETEAGMGILSGGINVITSPLAPVTAPVNAGVNAAADAISNSAAVQKFAASPAGATTARTAQDVGNTANVLGTAMGAKGGIEAAPLTKAANGISEATAPIKSEVGSPIGRIAEQPVALQGTNLLGKGDPASPVVNWVKPLPGYFDVIVHGSPDSFHVLHDGKVVNLNQRTLASYIEKNGYKGEPVRLLSCYTGSCSNGIAQDLANKLGTPVIAPSDKLWIFPDGRQVIGEGSDSNTGRWIIFNPTKP